MMMTSMWIIDGHRIKGINRNESEQKLKIPIVIFPKEFEVSNTAKVFAEINTLQTKLNPLMNYLCNMIFNISY